MTEQLSILTERLIDADLSMIGDEIRLSGSGTPKGVEEAAELMRTLPAGFNATTDLSLWDDGARLELTMMWDGQGATAQGKYPANFVQRNATALHVNPTP